jgi:hypothetical protein
MPKAITLTTFNITLKQGEYKCIIKFNRTSDAKTTWFTGYVAVPMNNKYFGMFYDDVMNTVSLPVELTYDSPNTGFGFDTAHSGMETDTYDDTVSMVHQLAEALDA